MAQDSLQLPVKPSPITVYQYLAFPLAVLLNYPECLPWFYSNYIQLEFFEEEKRVTLDFIGGWVTDIPWIRYQYFEKKAILNDFPEIHRSIKECLHEGWYFYSLFDEFYISNRRLYQKIHSNYDFLITGYDDREQEYSILGYGHRCIFETTKVNYSDFVQAFAPVIEGQFVILFRKRDDFDFGLDRKYLSQMFLDYLSSLDTSARLGLTQRARLKNRIFGLNTYYSLIEYFQSILDQPAIKDVRSFHRIFHALWEHKKCMLLRLEYLTQHGLLKKNSHFSTPYLKLEKDALILRNALLKYSLHEDERLLEKVIHSLREMRRLEADIVLELVQALKE
ncbi:MAG: hypothetical protein K6U80_05090 [Firmicutes bacterium]|nr:hypothetical protein [Bacillota bacterium]